jgi:hypothetical protein
MEKDGFLHFLPPPTVDATHQRRRDGYKNAAMNGGYALRRSTPRPADCNRMPILRPLFTEETDPLYVAGPPR